MVVAHDVWGAVFASILVLQSEGLIPVELARSVALFRTAGQVGPPFELWIENNERAGSALRVEKSKVRIMISTNAITILIPFYSYGFLDVYSWFGERLSLPKLSTFMFWFVFMPRFRSGVEIN